MLVLLAAVILQLVVHICIIRYVWNNVIIPLFEDSSLKKIDYVTAAFLLLLFRVLFTNYVYIPCNIPTPCEEACNDACTGL
jgi:hypothetical protein